MAKLTIEIEENEYALYDVKGLLNGKRFFEGDNFTSEDSALSEAYQMLKVVQWYDD